MATDPTFTDWLTAIGGVGAAAAAIVLAMLAYRQMVETRRQSSAALEQALISKEAVARQVFPLVYAHAWKGPQRREGEVAFRYYLTNEGLGPALNVEHGVTLGSRTHPFGHEEPFMFRTIQPGECLPPRPVDSTDPRPPEPITLMVESELVDDPPGEIVYWCRYESLFGERWETRNSSDPTKSPERTRLDQPESADSPPSVSA